MKYRNRPRIVEAEQWRPGVTIDGLVIVTTDCAPVGFAWDGTTQYNLRPGDWIVTEDGRRHVVDGCLFDALYEPLEVANE